MMSYLGGQTIFDVKRNKSVIFIDFIETEEKAVKKTYYSTFDGDDLNNQQTAGFSHIFETPVANVDRVMYHGKYCNGSLLYGIDEDTLIEDKNEVKKYLSSVDLKIKKGKLFIKKFEK